MSKTGSNWKQKKNETELLFLKSFVNGSRCPKSFAVKTVVEVKINPFIIRTLISSGKLCFDLENKKIVFLKSFVNGPR